MKRGFYVTITDIGRHYGKTPFEVGGIVKISKDRGNGSGKYDIRATLPMLGTVGHIGAAPEKIAGGTLSAEKIYNKIGKFAYAQIMFMTDFCIIAKVLRPEEVVRTPYLKAYRKKSKKRRVT